MSEFTHSRENDKGGIIRYKSRKVGIYTIAEDGGIVVDLAQPARRQNWSDEFGDDQEKIKTFLELGEQPEPPVREEPTVEAETPTEEEVVIEPELKEQTDEEILASWRASLIAKAEELGNIATLLDSGEGRIYKGPATQENIDNILSIDGVKEVLTNAQGVQ